MNDDSINEIRSSVARIERELRIIRRLIIAAICIAVLLVDPVLAIVGAFLCILWFLVDSMFRQADKKRIERLRVQELSGRSVGYRPQKP